MGPPACPHSQADLATWIIHACVCTEPGSKQPPWTALSVHVSTLEMGSQRPWELELQLRAHSKLPESLPQVFLTSELSPF